MSIEWQRTMTPPVVLHVIDARGIVPIERTDELGGGGVQYYFQKKRGKVFLHKKGQVEPVESQAQEDRKIKMAAARAAWRGLTYEEKQAWGDHSWARAFNLPGYQTFIRFYMKDLL